ncbi:MAG TPA: creatininase family protein, partial [Desulfobacterales bacterium]|nr:creatininase family protein [Desulfobacterales bacterium]
MKEDSLNMLGVIPQLEIGPIRLEANRVASTYALTQNGSTETMDLVYRFEEKVFDSEEPDSMNLGAMLTAQVALNYGLFCDKIVFHGLFDKADQQFLREMAANTAREIFVKKFLEPNPFIQGPAKDLSPVRKKSFLRAELLFPGSDTHPTTALPVQGKGGAVWGSDPSKHAILSSGGKDSLLSFGLLKEIGCEVHPIFINESGRHWFTALNAFRHFAIHVPQTSRVWTNSDRVFNWMLRQLPFVRQDFARIRSDGYPIRLWTVAVFLFGALPVLRKRGIGRILIGDEFDTTYRLSFKGITHYDGLYDQSRFFDDALTRYFCRKGWHVS